LVVLAAAAQPASAQSTTADVVYGQLGSFTTNTPNNGGVSANSISDARGVALDSSGNLYVADTANNRVLFYPAGSTTATRVYGQNGSFTTNGAGISANNLNFPWGIALDSSGNLYVADWSNNRVSLRQHYCHAGLRAGRQLHHQQPKQRRHQRQQLICTVRSRPGHQRQSLRGRDEDNSRVLFYPSGSTTATRSYGQGGSFTTNTPNNGGVSAGSFYLPYGVALDSSGNLYVADPYNNRVLFFPSGSTTATQVYGQLGSFTTNTPNYGGLSANSLYLPTGVALDSSGNLYVDDAYNNRALFFPSGSTTATRVYGQGGSFTTDTANNGGLSANSLDAPIGAALDSSGNLYVNDDANNRVLMYPPTTTPGIYGPAPGSTLTGTSVTFHWVGQPSASNYWLDIGSSSGGNNYLQSGQLPGSQYSLTANNLPSDGSPVYVTWWYEIGGSWSYTEYQYTAFGGSSQIGVITSPTPNSTLSGSTVNFTWAAGTLSSAYWIDAGSVPGGNQYYQSGNLGNVLSATVPGLPTNGSTVYITLWSEVNGLWLNNQYTYTAFNQAGGLGVMQTPTPGSTLNGNQATFTWSAGSASSAYWLDIGSTPGGNNYYQSGNLGNLLSTTVYTLPANGSQIYVTLWSLVNGQWLNNQYTYLSVPVTQVIMSIVVDRSGSMCGGSVPCESGVTGDDGGEALQSAVPTFVDLFNNTLDEVALLSFSDNARIDFPIGTGFQGPISFRVAAMEFVGGTFGTGAGTGALLSYTIGAPMSLADAQNNSIQLIQGQSVVKVLVYFTDGLMNTVQDNFYCGPSAPSVLINYGGYDSPVTDVGFFDPTCSPNLAFNGCTNEVLHVPLWGYCDGGACYNMDNQQVSGMIYDAAGDICKNAQGQPVTTFLSQQTGQQTTFTRANVTAEAQYRAIFTANAVRTESPVPTYIYTIGLSESISQSTADFLAQLANDPSYPNYNPSQPPGEFFYIPNCPGSTCTADLTAAFQEIAAKLL
jgi:sugar lactone lactonase YvrE